MKYYVIDPKVREIYEVEFEEYRPDRYTDLNLSLKEAEEKSAKLFLRQLYATLEIEIGEVVRLSQYHHLWIDEMGMLGDVEKQSFFQLEGITQPLAGKALVCGGYEKSVSPTVTIEHLRKHIIWLSFNDCKAIMPSFPPKITFKSFDSIEDLLNHLTKGNQQ